MDASLEAVFRDACYTIQPGGRSWRLVPDRFSPELERTMRVAGCREAALTTAANPGAVPLSDAENRARNAELRMVLVDLAIPTIEARNTASDGSWLEPSLLCLGLGTEAARALGRRFGQLAILHAGRDAIPRLLAC